MQKYSPSFDLPLNRRPRVSRAPSHTAATAGFIILVTFALTVTIAGASQLVDEVTAARSLRSGLTAIVLDLGLVVIGPVLVVAYFHLMPRLILARILAWVPGGLRGLIPGAGKNAGDRDVRRF